MKKSGNSIVRFVLMSLFMQSSLKTRVGFISAVPGNHTFNAFNKQACNAHVSLHVVDDVEIFKETLTNYLDIDFCLIYFHTLRLLDLQGNW